MSSNFQVTSRPELKIGDFKLTGERAELADKVMTRYPEGREASGIIPLLDLAQRENGGWLSPQAVDYVAMRTGSASIRVYEVASFYTMFNLNPVGKFHIQVCRTTPCWLRGSDALTNTCKSKLGISKGETSKDGLFTLTEVECLGACVNAPMVQINDDYYEDLDADSMSQLLDDLAAGKDVKIGTQADRLNSAPIGGAQTLTSTINEAKG